MAIIAPSLLSADFFNLKKEIETLEKTKCEMLHLDVMDGNYVPNISFGLPVIKSIRDHTKLLFDTHLMISNPDKFALDFIEAGSDSIIFHPETSKNPKKLIKEIQKQGCAAGLCINNNVPVSKAFSYLNSADLILIMSVNAGFGGQKFNPEALKKVKELREKADKLGQDIIISIDGGINDKTGKRAILMGADVLVAGNYIFKARNPEKAIQKLREL
ncbi:MAG: ribulose-phosphate 3-epimerase [Candidatus Diapherotrites archaeon]